MHALKQFGAYTRKTVSQGLATVYAWPIDNGIAMAVKASINPTNGILEFQVAHLPASGTLK